MKKSLLSTMAGDVADNPMDVKLSDQTIRLLHATFEDLSMGQIWDYHVHILGIGTGGTGCWVNPTLRSWLHPVDHIKMDLYINGAGIKDMDQADQQYVNRLVSMARSFPGHGKFCLLALDKCYHRDGTINQGDTKFHVPNEYVFRLSQSYPDLFIPCISVHPYRRDALDELDKWGELGVKMIKWMPSTMGMDASEPICDRFYEKMRTYDRVLLTHVGKEDAMQVVKFKPLNNPLLFRRPLDQQVKVIMAHCASLGMNMDLEAATQGVEYPKEIGRFFWLSFVLFN